MDSVAYRCSILGYAILVFFACIAIDQIVNAYVEWDKHIASEAGFLEERTLCKLLTNMKVLYILHNHSMEGSLISFLNLAQEMRLKGVEVHVSIIPQLNENREILNRFEALGIIWYVIPVIPSVLSNDFFINTSSYRIIQIIYGLIWRKALSLCRLVKIIRKVRPDIVHTNSGVIHEGFWAAKICRCPHVWHLREYQDKDFHFKPWLGMRHFRYLLHYSEVITITHDIAHHFNIATLSNSHIIYNGICKEDDVAYEDIKDDYFLCASRISPEKGHHKVIEAFVRFCNKYPNYRLLIAGDGDKEYIQSLIHYVKEKKCLDKVLFLGFCSNVKELMIHAKALIVASRSEGFGRMTAEAAFYGCLTIGYNMGGTKEILDVIGGFPWNDEADALYIKMEEVMSLSSQQYTQKACYAQTRAVNLYSIEKSGEQIYNVYRKLLQT